MLGIKNQFSKSTPNESPGPSGTIFTDAAAKLKGLQLLKGRTRAKIETLQTEVDTARADLARATQSHGGALYEEKDATEEAAAVQQAGNRVAALGAALAVAIQKDDAAQAELQQAERQVEDDAKDAARERLLALAQEGEEILVHINLFRADLVRETAAAFAAGGIASWGEREVVEHFNLFLARANRSAAANRADSGAFMKYPSWTTCLKYVCGKIQP